MGVELLVCKLSHVYTCEMITFGFRFVLQQHPMNGIWLWYL